MAVGTANLTVEDFDQLAERPENADRRLEYIRGEMVEVVSNNYASVVASKINFFVQLFLAEHGIEGYVTGADGGYQVAGERYIPDVAFISKARQSEPCHDASNPLPPDLAVEVLSPSDDLNLLRVKIANYLAAGTVVWLVRPDVRTVEVYAPGQPVQPVGADGTLDGGDIRPGFALAVADIFPE